MKEVVIRISIEGEAAAGRPPSPTLTPTRAATLQQLELGTPVLTFPVGTALAEIEREAISRTLEHFGGNKARAAAALEIDASTLYRKLKRQRSGA